MTRRFAPTTLVIVVATLFGVVTGNADFVIDDDGEELRAIVTDAGSVESRVYKKQFPGGRKE